MHFLDVISVWTYFIATIVIASLSFEGGYQIGVILLRKNKIHATPPFEGLSPAILGLLAFLMAFTFSLAASRFDNRRELVVEEANAIGTTYLRAGYLPEPYKNSVQSLLKVYAKSRIDAVQTKNYGEGFKASEEIHKKLWEQVETLVGKGFDSPAISLFISSLNETIDLNAKRILMARGMRIPGIIWVVLFTILVLSMAILGYFSSFKASRSPVVNFVVIIAFSLVMYLIADLDHPQEGFLKVTQQPLIDTLNSMK